MSLVDSDPDFEDRTFLQTAGEDDRIAAWVQATVDRAPALKPEQLRLLADLLGGG